MDSVGCFDSYFNEYESWFDRNSILYQKELEVLRNLVGSASNGIDIGSGSGRFSIKPNIKIGVEPSRKMRDIALQRGVVTVEGYAENLPFEGESFDFALMMTSICFVENPLKAIKEAYRVLKKDGFLIIGFIDKNSNLGREYEERKEQSKFYKYANFYSLEDVLRFAKDANFDDNNYNCVNTEFGMVFLKLYKKLSV